MGWRVILILLTKESNNMVNSRIFQIIFDELSKYLSPSWEKLIVCNSLSPDCPYGVFFIEQDGEYVKCDNLQYASQEEIENSLNTIHDILSGAIQEDVNDERTVFTMVVEPDGHMNAFFDYCKAKEQQEWLSNGWTQKYLN